MSSGAILKQHHVNRQEDDFRSVFNSKMYWQKRRFLKICVCKNGCGCWQNTQAGGLPTLSLRRKKYPMTKNKPPNWVDMLLNFNQTNKMKNKPIYHSWNVKRWKVSVKHQPFINLLPVILDMINRFIFGHGVLIYSMRILHKWSWKRPWVRSPCPVHSFMETWSWKHFYNHSPSSSDSRRAVVSYWRKNVYLVLVNCLGDLSRNSVDRLTDLARNDLKCVEGP